MKFKPSILFLDCAKLPNERQTAEDQLQVKGVKFNVFRNDDIS